MEGQIELTAETLWTEVAGRLKGALNTTTYRTWFAGAGGAELTDEAFVITVPNGFTREWIEGHFLGLWTTQWMTLVYTGAPTPLRRRVFSPSLHLP